MSVIYGKHKHYLVTVYYGDEEFQFTCNEWPGPNEIKEWLREFCHPNILEYLDGEVYKGNYRCHPITHFYHISPYHVNENYHF